LKFYEDILINEDKLYDSHELYKTILMTFLNNDYFDLINVISYNLAG